MLRGPVWMFVEKFGRDVFIDAEHPLAVAQRAANDAAGPDNASAPTTDTPSASAPAVTVSPDAPRAKRSRKS